VALQKLIQDKLNLLENVTDTFESSAASAQQGILNDILLRLDSLQRTAQGAIVTNTTNLGIVQTVLSDLEGIVTGSQYVEAVSEYVQGFDKSLDLNTKYFTNILDDDVIDTYTRAYITAQKRAAAEAFIGSSGIAMQYRQPLEQLLNNAVSSGSTYLEMVDDIRLNIIGAQDRLGIPERYVKRIARDAIYQTDAASVKAMSDENDIQFYRYAGGTVDDTRDFCMKRNNKVYTREEIENWGNIQSWQGRISGTNSSNIWTYRGGYNCRHFFVPVSESRYEQLK